MTAAERPATGATDEQIEAAINRKFDRHYAHAVQHMKPETISTLCSLFYPEMTAHAADLVPPGTVIALAEHVTDAADRAAIGRVVVRELDDRQLIGPSMSDDDLARLERMSGEGERG